MKIDRVEVREIPDGRQEKRRIAHLQKRPREGHCEVK